MSHWSHECLFAPKKNKSKSEKGRWSKGVKIVVFFLTNTWGFPAAVFFFFFFFGGVTTCIGGSAPWVSVCSWQEQIQKWKRGLVEGCENCGIFSYKHLLVPKASTAARNIWSSSLVQLRQLPLSKIALVIMRGGGGDRGRNKCGLKGMFGAKTDTNSYIWLRRSLCL